MSAVTDAFFSLSCKSTRSWTDFAASNLAATNSGRKEDTKNKAGDGERMNVQTLREREADYTVCAIALF